MRIKEITIKNFRGFTTFTRSLDPIMNVVLANNTKGKTTLLQAIQISLGAYLQSLTQLPKESAFRKNFKSEDRTMEYSEAIEDFIYSTKGNPTISVHALMSTFGKQNGIPFEEEKEIRWNRRTVNFGQRLYCGKGNPTTYFVMRLWKRTFQETFSNH